MRIARATAVLLLVSLGVTPAGQGIAGAALYAFWVEKVRHWGA